jgi:hypothetical protein
VLLLLIHRAVGRSDELDEVAAAVASATPQAIVASWWPTASVLLAIRSARRLTIRSGWPHR